MRKLATVGIKELDTSVTGLAAKQTLLTEKLDLQRRSLTQYEAALQGANEIAVGNVAGFLAGNVVNQVN